MKSLVFGVVVRVMGSTPTTRVAWLQELNVVGILVIGSYIYHSDVIVTSMQSYVNIIQIHIIYYLPIYCIYPSSTRCHNVPQISSSV